jgi:hypothetical protein
MKKILSITLLFFSFNFSAFSQGFCYTDSNVPDFLRTISPDQYVYSKSTDTYAVRVFFYIIRKSNGEGGVTQEEVKATFNILNSDYQPYGICFETWGIAEIHNSGIYWKNAKDFRTTNGKFVDFNAQSHSYAIDIYVFAEESNIKGGKAAGNPGSAIVIGGTYNNGYSIESVIPSHLISHEIGHCLGLFHTSHGMCGESSEETCIEWANGTNCEDCGDYVCDTPADPGNLDVNLDCEWSGINCSGDTIDYYGNPYHPRTDLFMAIIPFQCMKYHTPGQVARMKETMSNYHISKDIARTIPTDLILSGAINGTRDYVALETITSTQIVNNGSTFYKAGAEIFLEPGFHAKNGANFVAKIGTYSCNQYELFMDGENKKISAAPPIKNSQNEMVTKEIKLHPNPNNGSFQLETNFPIADIAHLKITNLLGITVYETKNLTSHTLQLQNSAAGLYFVIMMLKDGSVLTQKMVVQ